MTADLHDTPDLRTLAAEPLARMFHEAYERLAPSFGYETRQASAKPWAEVPENNRALMTAVCSEILAEYPAAHRRQVLAEAADAITTLLDRYHQDLTLDTPADTAAYRAGRQAINDAVAIVRRLASAAPETAPTPRHGDETAPAVPEATPEPAEGNEAGWADARAAARAWLAGTLHCAQCACAFRDGRCVAYGMVHRALADAILSAPGVEVERKQVSFRQAQVVIRLPAQPIGETT